MSHDDLGEQAKGLAESIAAQASIKAGLEQLRREMARYSALVEKMHRRATGAVGALDVRHGDIDTRLAKLADGLWLVRLRSGRCAIMQGLPDYAEEPVIGQPAPPEVPAPALEITDFQAGLLLSRAERLPEQRRVAF